MASFPVKTARTALPVDAEVADWKALHTLAQTLLQPGSLDQKLHEALRAVCGFHQTTRSVISLYDPQSQTLGVRASTGMPAAALVGLNGVAPGNGACGRAFASGERFVFERFDSMECLAEYQPWAKEFSVEAVYSTPFFDSGHAVIGVLSFYFDHPHCPSDREMLLADLCAGTISLFIERAHSEELVAFSEARYRALTETLSAIVWRWMPDTDRFLDVRGWESFTGQPPIEHTRAGWMDMVHPEDRERVHAMFATAYVALTPCECNCRLLNRNGNYHHVRVVGAPVIDPSGTVVEWIGSCEDVTAIKEAQDNLITANRRKDEFLAILSHELRNPLSATKAAATLLQMPEIGTSRTEHLGQVIARQVGHMSRLVEDLVDVSRIAQGLVVLHPVEVDMIEVVNTAVEQIKPMIDAKHHLLVFQSRGQPCLVKGDKTRLVQVVANLLSNAARYTPDHGSIVLALHSSAGAVSLAIKDNGVGIDPTSLSTLFDLYMQAERSSDRANGGLGLGLALVKSMIELHGGTVSAASDGKNMGSSFVINLPSVLPAGSAADNGKAGLRAVSLF